MGCRDGLLRPLDLLPPADSVPARSKRTFIAESGLKKTTHSAAEIDTPMGVEDCSGAGGAECGWTEEWVG